MDAGREAIDDAAELAQVRRQARRVYRRATAVAALLTAAAFLFP